MNGLLKPGNPGRQASHGPASLINPKVGNKQLRPIAQPTPAPRDDTAPSKFAQPINTQPTMGQSSAPGQGGGLLGSHNGIQVGGPVERPPLSGEPSDYQLPISKPAPVTDAPGKPTESTNPPSSNPQPGQMTTTGAEPTSTSTAVRPGTNLETDVSQVERPESSRGDYESLNRPGLEGQDTREDASVANQLNGLLAEDSPYIQQARQQAAQEAASRGLRNTTMGVQAGQQAAISQALPIAQQDAQQNFQLQQNEQMQGYQLDQSLYNALLTGERDAVMQEYGLDQAQYNAAMQQAQMQNQQGFELDRMDYQTQLQSVLNNEQHQQTLERMDVDQKNQLETINQQFVNQMETMGIEMEHQARMAYTQSSTMIMQSAMEQLGFIYSNPEMSPEQQGNAVRTVMGQLQEQLTFTSSLFQPFPGLDFEPTEGQPGGNTSPGSGGNPGSGGGSGGGGNTPTPPGNQQRQSGGGGLITDNRFDNQMQR